MIRRSAQLFAEEDPAQTTSGSAMTVHPNLIVL
jgi:hypothetical protein